MIHDWEIYCDLWNLNVNVNKSKIIIFQSKKCKLSSNEKWKFNQDTIDVVNTYKYLGVLLNPQLNFKEHFIILD
uniref:Rna-directed dna polymerase from mobile element jockey-like protein n=1 Tax=Triatoma infestans TaxID=30076 RepID=A0A161MH93_TRIIF